MGYFYDYTYIFMIPALLISLYAQFKVNSTFKKYSKVRNSRYITGAEAAKRVLMNSGINDVIIERVSGNLTDHFDPISKVIRLSDSVYNSTSVSAIGVAAHEAGHAVQYNADYYPIRLRNFLIPVTKFSSTISLPLVFIGLLLPTGYTWVVVAGAILFSVSMLFELVTLPVEFNASRRAIQAIETTGLLNDQEIKGAKKVLSAAAMTYLAAMITSLLTLLRLLFIIIRRNN